MLILHVCNRAHSYVTHLVYGIYAVIMQCTPVSTPVKCVHSFTQLLIIQPTRNFWLQEFLHTHFYLQHVQYSVIYNLQVAGLQAFLWGEGKEGQK